MAARDMAAGCQRGVSLCRCPRVVAWILRRSLMHRGHRATEGIFMLSQTFFHLLVYICMSTNVFVLCKSSFEWAQTEMYIEINIRSYMLTVDINKRIYLNVHEAQMPTQMPPQTDVQSRWCMQTFMYICMYVCTPIRVHYMHTIVGTRRRSRRRNKCASQNHYSITTITAMHDDKMIHDIW
jgi:uncharacterized membrane protein